MFSNVVLVGVVVALAVWVTTRVLRNRRRAKDPNYRPETPEEAAARIDQLIAQNFTDDSSTQS